jgi:hypothetical protein
MILKLKSKGTPPARSLNETAQACAEGTLGRLARRTSHAVVSVRSHEQATGRSVYACPLRLRIPGATDVLVENYPTAPQESVERAFRADRIELMRRGREARRARAWHRQPESAAA